MGIKNISQEVAEMNSFCSRFLKPNSHADCYCSGNLTLSGGH